MATIQGYTKARMDEIVDDTIVSAAIDISGHLILTQFGGGTVDAGGLPSPDASDTVKGIVELATNAETITGSDTVRAVTPAGLAAASTTLVPDASTTVKGRVELATDAETITGTDTVRAITPSNLTARVASTTATGIVELATSAETITGSDTARVVTPAGLQAKVASDTASGIVELATNAEALTGTDNTRAATPANLGALLGVTQESEVAGSGTTTSTSYTATLTGSTTPQKAFTAPQSGKVLIHWSAYMTHSIANGFCYMSFEIRDGASLGAGSVVVAGSDTNAIVNRVSGAGSDDAQFGSTKLITGLTPGNSYNIQGLYKLVTAGTLTTINRRIIVQPVL
jgi:hypothetical protein